jgi:hypothetical protein
LTIATGGDELALAASWSSAGKVLSGALPAPDAKQVATQRIPAANTATERRGGFKENAPFDLHESIQNM